MRTVLSIFLFFGVFLSLPSFAINCKQAQTATDKIICADTGLLEQDKSLNETYTKIIKQLNAEQKEKLKQNLKELLEAREGCMTLYDIPIDQLFFIPPANDNTDGDEAFWIGKRPSFELKNNTLIDKQGRPNLIRLFYKGCINTWYNTVITALNNQIKSPETYKIPSALTYIEAFKKLIPNLPLSYKTPVARLKEFAQCKKENPDSYPDKCLNPKTENKHFSITYTMYFFKHLPSIAIGSEYTGFFTAAPYGNESWKIYFINLSTEQTLPDLQPFRSVKMHCNVPINNLVELKNKFYLPQNLSFSQETRQTLGTYENWGGPIRTVSYVPDCLALLVPIDNTDKEQYLVFNNDFWDTKAWLLQLKPAPNAFNETEPMFSSACIKKLVEPFKKKSQSFAKMEGEEGSDLYFVKRNEFQSIIQQIKQQCSPKP